MSFFATKTIKHSALATLLSLGVFATAQAQAVHPNAVVEQIANQAWSSLLNDSAARSGDVAAVNRLI